MDIQKLLSVIMATLASLGSLLLAMGQRSPWLAMLLWTAAMVSLIVTDFAGWFRLNRNVASVILFGILLFFLRSCLSSYGEARLLALAQMLTWFQVIFLFQEKEERVYWWLAVMSLLQVVVAAGFDQGVGFGALLIVYMLLGMVALTLLFLYGEANRHRETKKPLIESDGLGRRWPLSREAPSFTSTPVGIVHSGIVMELFARLALVAFGAIVLALVIFFTVPRPGISAWRGAGATAKQMVGFNDKITLGALGEVLENRDEVMRLQLFDAANHLPYSMHGDIYLRGAVVTHYENRQWSRELVVGTGESPFHPPLSRRLGGRARAVEESITVEPSFDQNALFYIWPLLGPVRSQNVLFDPDSEQLTRTERARGSRFRFFVYTNGLVDGVQMPLIPCDRNVMLKPLLQSPGGPSELTRVKALAGKWVAESRIPIYRQYDLAKEFERRFATSGDFRYSLRRTDADGSIDPIEDFVSKHRTGNCEYFATALALMLRSQGIATRVVLGYHCDEWNSVGKFFQVRQLHAHAWVEAYLDPDQIPESELGDDGTRWAGGGWLRLDATPSAEVGTRGADRSTWYRWESRFNGIESAWDDYVLEMDRQRQQEAIYRPVLETMREARDKLVDPGWWRQVGHWLWATVAVTGWSGIVGWILRIGLWAALATSVLGGGWLIARASRRAWWRIMARRKAGESADGSSVEFYRRFENLFARHGLVRPAGQTPREFAQAAGERLATRSGRAELADSSRRIVESFYRVRYGRGPLDNSEAQAVEHSLGELASVAVETVRSDA